MFLSRREYHGLSRGFILQEVFRRVVPGQETMGQFLQKTVFSPLGARAHIGLAEHLQTSHKIADVEALSPKEVAEAAAAAEREDVTRLLEKFLSYSSETEGRRLDQRPPWAGMRDTFDIGFWNSAAARRAEVSSRDTSTINN